MSADFYSIQTININTINFEDTTFSCRFFDKPNDMLTESIKKWGLLTSPLLRQTDDHRYQIILGFQRLKVIKRLNYKEITCFVIKKRNDPSVKALWEIIISELLSTGNMNLFDQSVLFNKILQYFPKQWVTDNILPLFGLSPSAHILDRICPLIDLEQELALAVLEDQISQQMAIRLLNLSSPERLCLGRLFVTYKYSKSKQFEILEHVLDLKAIHSKEIDKLIYKVEETFSEQMHQMTAFNLPQKAELIRNKIRSWRYPTLTDLEEHYDKAIKSLKLGQGISLKPPSFFEGNTFQISITFQTIETLLDKITQLNTNIGSQKKIWHEIQKVQTSHLPKSPKKY
ncbi:MAG: ParB/RepB/Spo0J family partition protein [bacterium]